MSTAASEFATQLIVLIKTKAPTLAIDNLIQTFLQQAANAAGLPPQPLDPLATPAAIAAPIVYSTNIKQLVEEVLLQSNSSIAGEAAMMWQRSWERMF